MADTIGEAVKSGMARDPKQPGEARAALVKQIIERVKSGKKHWDRDYKRMRRNMDFASGKQWPNQTEDDDRYKVNITQRMVKAAVSSLYAKNPTVVAKRRQRLDFTLWDGQLASLEATKTALQQAAANGQPAPPQAVALMQDVQQGVERRTTLDKIGKTLETLARYYMEEDTPDFKLQMKQMVRRARTTGVGYVEIAFQRQMELSDDQSTRISDMSERIAEIGRMQADLQDGEVCPYEAEAERLRLAMEAMHAEPSHIVREGLVFMFPLSTRIIPSPSTQKLVGWIGADWIAKELILQPETVEAVYGIDVGKDFTAYQMDIGRPESAARRRVSGAGKGLCCVWHLYEKATGLEYIVCDGYPDFLKEPSAPDVKVEQFFPIFAVTFNDVEDEDRLFADSDVELMKHVQKEYNRCKEAKRQHRIANRPLYLAPDGQFDEGEEATLSNYPAHAVIKVKAMRDGTKAEDLLAPVKKIGVDPNLYETEEIFADMLRVTGFQEANLGGTSNSTATQSSIAASSLSGSIGLDADDLDEMLSAIWRSAGQIMMMEMSEETVKRIAGPGAIWPTMTMLEIMEEVNLEVKAGSSGRPNQAQEAATLERMYPLLIQIPGISPTWLGKLAIGIADDNIDLEDAIIDGLPSIMAQNAMAQPGTGNPATNPAQQGPAGAANSPQAPPAGGTAQPGFPAPGGGQSPHP